MLLGFQGAMDVVSERFQGISRRFRECLGSFEQVSRSFTGVKKIISYTYTFKMSQCNFGHYSQYIQWDITNWTCKWEYLDTRWWPSRHLKQWHLWFLWFESCMPIHIWWKTLQSINQVIKKFSRGCFRIWSQDSFRNYSKE